MAWKTCAPEVVEKVEDEVFKQTIRKTRRIPCIINTTHFIKVIFLRLAEPIFEYDAFYSDNRSLHLLAAEQKVSFPKTNVDLEDVNLPPDRD